MQACGAQFCAAPGVDVRCVRREIGVEKSCWPAQAIEDDISGDAILLWEMPLNVRAATSVSGANPGARLDDPAERVEIVFRFDHVVRVERPYHIMNVVVGQVS